MARIRTVKPEIWSDEESSSRAVSFWIYCLAEDGCEREGPCKIGIATNLTKRLASLQGGNWRQLNLVWQIRLADRDVARQIEQRLLIDFRPNPYGSTQKTTLKSEWVSISPTDALTRAADFLSICYCPVRRVA